jgi:flagellar motor switch protein FliG
MDNRDIALLLKGRSLKFTEKILSNVSASRRAMIREEAEILGPVPKIEVEAAARDFLAWFRLGREEGKILLRTDEDVIV